MHKCACLNNHTIGSFQGVYKSDTCVQLPHYSSSCYTGINRQDFRFFFRAELQSHTHARARETSRATPCEKLSNINHDPSALLAGPSPLGRVTFILIGIRNLNRYKNNPALYTTTRRPRHNNIQVYERHIVRSISYRYYISTYEDTQLLIYYYTKTTLHTTPPKVVRYIFIIIVIIYNVRVIGAI